MTLAKWQKEALAVYGDGDYSHAESVGEIKGDTLALFLVIETDPSEDCVTRRDAIARLERAINDLQEVVDHLGDKELEESRDDLTNR